MCVSTYTYIHIHMHVYIYIFISIEGALVSRRPYVSTYCVCFRAYDQIN